MREQTELYNDIHTNPLDCVEDILQSHNWIYDRTNNQSLRVDVAGKACNYAIIFSWHEHMNVLQLACEYDMIVTPENAQLCASALMDINEKLWMGHYEVPSDNNKPRYRYTALMNDEYSKTQYAQIETLVDVCLTQCERFQPVFELLCNERATDIGTLSFAMMEPAGES